MCDCSGLLTVRRSAVMKLRAVGRKKDLSGGVLLDSREFVEQPMTRGFTFATGATEGLEKC